MLTIQYQVKKKSTPQNAPLQKPNPFFLVTCLHHKQPLWNFLVFSFCHQKITSTTHSKCNFNQLFTVSAFPEPIIIVRYPNYKTTRQVSVYILELTTDLRSAF